MKLALGIPSDTPSKNSSLAAIATGVRAAVSEIQRRNRERNHVIVAMNGDRSPVMTTEEMNKIIMQFIESSLEGLG